MDNEEGKMTIPLAITATEILFGFGAAVVLGLIVAYVYTTLTDVK